MKRLIWLLLFIAWPAFGQTISDGTLLSAATGTGAGSSVTLNTTDRVYQAVGATTNGAGSATVKVQGSVDNGTTWVDLGTITLTLSTTASADGFASAAPWKMVRGNVTGISGTGANVSLYVGHR